MARGGWVYIGGRAGNKPPAGEKSVIATACSSHAFYPTKFNYPIAIYGKWHGNKYRFITRYRSDDPNSYEPEFEAPFARLEYVCRDTFDLSYHRHTGEWLCIFQRVSLADALELLETTPHFQPC